MIDSKLSTALSSEPDISEEVYFSAAQASFDFLEQFALEIMPLIWPKEATVLQAQVSSFVFARQMLGEYFTVSSIATELDVPRSSIQYTVDKMIEQGRLASKPDPDDGRRRLIFVPANMADDAAAAETILVRFIFYWHQRIEDILDSSNERRNERLQRDELRAAVKNLRKIIKRFGGR